jgi:hypothetical protein
LRKDFCLSSTIVEKFFLDWRFFWKSTQVVPAFLYISLIPKSNFFCVK